MTDHPLIICCPLVGAELTRDDYPYLPLTPEEIAREAEKAVQAGASIIHLHVRDELGRPTQRVDVFQEVTRKIKKRCDCILQYSTGGAVGTPLQERYAPLQLQPEMATLSMGTINFGTEIYENSRQTIFSIAEAIRKNNILPELEIFDLGMLDTVERYQQKGYIPDKYHVDFVLGVPGALAATPANLMLLVDRLHPDQTWSVAGLGKAQLILGSMAIGMGGHVRVGIEDNIYYRKGELATSNAQLIDRMVRIAGELERPVASVVQARSILGL